MRLLLAAILGAAIGALLTFSAANTWQRHRAYPRGVMAVAQHHYARLRDALRQEGCATAALPDRLQRLAASAREIEPAFADTMAGDPGFRQRAQALDRLLAGTLATPPMDCTALNRAVRDIDDACEACHREYR